VDTKSNGEAGALPLLQGEGEFALAKLFRLGKGKESFEGLVLV
jgi:hypothetical protein